MPAIIYTGSQRNIDARINDNKCNLFYTNSPTAIVLGG